MAHVKITPLHPSLGAAVEGVDLAEPGRRADAADADRARSPTIWPWCFTTSP